MLLPLYICVSWISILPLSTIFLLNFRTVPTVWYFLFFILLLEQKRLYSSMCWTLLDHNIYFNCIFRVFLVFIFKFHMLKCSFTMLLFCVHYNPWPTFHGFVNCVTSCLQHVLFCQPCHFLFTTCLFYQPCNFLITTI